MNLRGVVKTSAVGAVARGKIKLNNDMRSWFKFDPVGSNTRGSQLLNQNRTRPEDGLNASSRPSR